MNSGTVRAPVPRPRFARDRSRITSPQAAQACPRSPRRLKLPAFLYAASVDEPRHRPLEFHLSLYTTCDPETRPPRPWITRARSAAQAADAENPILAGSHSLSVPLQGCDAHAPGLQDFDECSRPSGRTVTRQNVRGLSPGLGETPPSGLEQRGQAMSRLSFPLRRESRL